MLIRNHAAPARSPAMIYVSAKQLDRSSLLRGTLIAGVASSVLWAGLFEAGRWVFDALL